MLDLWAVHILFCNNYLAVKWCCESNHQAHYLLYQKCQKSEIKGHIHIHEITLHIVSILSFEAAVRMSL